MIVNGMSPIRVRAAQASFLDLQVVTAFDVRGAVRVGVLDYLLRRVLIRIAGADVTAAGGADQNVGAGDLGGAEKHFEVADHV
jgi:hypothetical protein